MAYTVNSDAPAIVSLPFRALGGQPAFEPEALDDFLADDRIAMLAYRRADGRPNQAPIWYAYREGTLWFSVESTSPKLSAIRRDPRVTVAIQDERPPYRAAIIDGTVDLVDLGADASENLSLAVRYFGRVAAATYERMYRETREAAGTTLLRLVPTEVKGFDNTRAIGLPTLAFVRARHRLRVPKRWL